MTIYHSRNIEEYIPLNKKEVLERVSPFSIYERYFQQKIVLGKAYNSPFRKDTNPSFAFHESKGKLKFIDFSSGESGDCFDFLGKMYSLNFFECLNLVNEDFSLNLGKNTKNLKVKKKIVSTDNFKINRSKPLFQIEVQKYTSHDIEY